MSRVSLTKGNDRKENIRRSLDLIAGDIARRFSRKQPVIKPNLVSSTIPLASSHADQIRGILDFFTSIYQGTIIIAEASCQETREAYRNFGYLDLLREYPLELVDLNDGPFERVTAPGVAGRPLELRIASLLLDRSKYLVSAARLKTHDTVLVSLGVKNLAMGSIYCGDRKAVHAGIRETNRYIADIAGRVWPDLSVLDGFEGMEGDGPSCGDAVPLRIAIAGTDALAADRVACEVMGVDLHAVGYLHYCAEERRGEADLGKIEILGERLGSCVRPFRLHRNSAEQHAWK